MARLFRFGIDLTVRSPFSGPILVVGTSVLTVHARASPPLGPLFLANRILNWWRSARSDMVHAFDTVIKASRYGRQWSVCVLRRAQHIIRTVFILSLVEISLTQVFPSIPHHRNAFHHPPVRFGFESSFSWRGWSGMRVVRR